MSAHHLHRRGVYFTIDAMLAAAIIATGLVLLLSYPPHDQDSRQLETTTYDAVTMLNTLTVGEINNTLTAQVIATNLTTSNDTVLHAIGVLWATNNSLAPNYTQMIFSNFSTALSYGVYAEGTYLAGVNNTPQAGATRIVSSRQQVSGIAQGKPVSGSTATGLLKKIENKSTASFVTFGGFVGQGNLTVIMHNIPSDISAANIRDVTLELDTNAPIDLLVNGVDCGYYVPAPVGNVTVTSWNVTGCNAAFHVGDNTIDLKLNTTIDEAAVYGGFLRVRYITNQQPVAAYPSPLTYTLPGINGIVNLYDGFYVPPNMSSMAISLHYIANHTNLSQNITLFVTIGNITVWRDNASNTSQTVLLTDANLTPFLNYTALSGTTVPIRIGFDNLTYTAILSGDADVVIATDTSGSMAWRMDVDNVNGILRECNNILLNDSDTERLSVAKCLDKQFVTDILNITGNTIGAVSYSTSTNNAQTVQLTTNLTNLTTTIGNTTTGYVANGNTCICCGVNTGVGLINKSILRTVFVPMGATWKYNFTQNKSTDPANDSSNRPWYDTSYANAGAWPSGPAVLGSNENGTGPAIVTDMGNAMNAISVSVNLSKWKTVGGLYGYDSTVNFAGNATNGFTIDMNTSPNNRNNCATNDCSGAENVTFNITSTYWNMIQNGSARLTFKYTWTPNPAQPFGNGDAMWIKARITDPSKIVTWLGTELGNKGADATVEVDYRAKPNAVVSGTFTQDISSLITGPGNYTFDFGGKLFGSATTHWGRFAFNTIALTINNQTDVYFLRQTFNVTNISQAQTGLLNLLSDDRATVYLNGNLVVDEGYAQSAQYWNEHGITIPQTSFRVGTNVLAIKLENVRGTTKVDAELGGLNTSRVLAMLVMTDGVSNQRCAAQGTGDALQDAIQSACQARERYGISVNTVGYSDGADNDTLAAAADCGGGLFASSANASALTDFYRSVVVKILDSALRSQSVVVAGGFAVSTLFPDSSITLQHAAQFPTLQPNEIGVTTQSPPFGSCTPTVTLAPNVRVLSARIESYSGVHWTDLITANGIPAYNLSSYSVPYIQLGDPFDVHLPAGAVTGGANNLFVNTGDAPGNGTGCSPSDTLITDLAVPLNASYTPVLERAVGCTWTIELDYGGFQNITVPSTYSGANTCNYTNASIAYDGVDAYDVATVNLLRSLDYNSDGRIFLSLADQDVEIIVNTVSNVPYLWGPSLIEVRAWQ